MNSAVIFFIGMLAFAPVPAPEQEPPRPPVAVVPTPTPTPATSKPAVVPKPTSAPPKPILNKSDRQLVIDMAMTQVGIMEATGRNDGPVEKYIASVGMDPKAGLPYCAAFNYWVGREALGSRNPYPKSAWSPSHVSGGVSPTSTNIKGAETFGIYFNNLKRIGHTGFVKERSGSYLITIEANTSSNAAVGSAADRDGQGVFSKRRHINTVRLVRDWIKD
jgi:hypothetical protein